jgi:DNA-binding transcriptional regulator YiaG
VGFWQGCLMKQSEALKLARARELAASGRGEEIRTRSRFTRAEFARLCGVSHVTIMRWERGERRPHGAPATRYVDLLEALERQSAEVVS